jgi:hypothetical protein
MLTDVSEVRTASIIALMMEAVRTPQTSVSHKLYYTAQHPRRLNFNSDERLSVELLK